MLVLDTSIIVAWTMPDEHDPLAEAVIEFLEVASAVTPDLFWHEVRNVLLVNVRRGRISPAQMIEFMDALRALPIRDVEQANDRLILEIAERRSLSAYDAAYLALAKVNNGELATLDRKLQRAAADEDVLLWTVGEGEFLSPR